MKVARFRLSYSRKMFLAAYPRKSQEMVLDAHTKAFATFGGASKLMVYDNLKHGAPFRQWDLPASIGVVHDRLLKQDKGYLAFVELLLMVRDLGGSALETLEVACDLTLETRVVTAAIVLNEMRRLTEAVRPKVLPAIAWLPNFKIEPTADCARYDALTEYCHGY